MNQDDAIHQDNLAKRLDHIESLSRYYLFALELMASMVHLHGETCLVRDPGRILEEAGKFLDRLDLDFHATAFLLTDEVDSSFVLTRCQPEQETGMMQQLADDLMDNGQFAWALNQNRPVLVNRSSGGKVLLHVLATKSRVRGMFVGVLERVETICTQDGAVSLAMESLLSIVFHNTAYALESAELYRLMDDLNHRLEEGMRLNLFRLQDQNQELERKVVELEHSRRELACSEARLRTALQAADAANRAKSDFLANVSHEIRTPMNAVIGLTDTLMETNLDAEQRRYLRIIASAGESLLTVINDVLDMSRIESGRLELELAPFSLREEMETIRAILEPHALHKGVAFVCQIAAAVPDHWLGDASRLRQILINLLGNAIKFTQHGSVHLEVASMEDKGDGLRLTVTDTGIGIPAAYLATIFERFVQSDATITRRFGGTGLGLAICRSLVEMMGGRIAVDSQVGRGSRFQVAIPLARSDANACPIIHDLDLAGRRILVIDDQADNRLVFRKMLEPLGADITEAATATTGREYLLQAQQAGRPFDMLLLDNFLCDGNDCQTFLTAIPRSVYPLAILILSSTEPLSKSAMPGMVLLKPIHRTTLLAAIAGQLANGSPASHAVTPTGPPVRLLVAEDSEDNRLLLQVYLKSIPHTVTFVEDGQQAVTAWGHGDFDLVLMDMQMPNMDGYEATRLMRAMERESQRPAIPILALTAFAMKEDTERSLLAGCNGHLTKPIRKNLLLEAIARFAQRPGETVP